MTKQFQSVIAASKIYFQQNQIKSPVLFPVPITCNLTSGWAFSATKPKSSLLDAIESLIGKDIIIHEFDHKGAENIDGMLVEEDGKAIIFVNKALNFCWRRFIVAKELTHLLLNNDAPECRATSADQVKSVIRDFFIENYFESKDGYKKSEHEAFIMAIELLFPRDYVDIAQEMDPKDIAAKVKIPVRAIEARLIPFITGHFGEIYNSQWYENADLYERVARANG